MARVKIVIDPDEVARVASEPEFKALLMAQAQKVANEAQATAQQAQGGPGGKLQGYAEAGFSVVWESRSRRPRVLIKSNASPEMALRVHLRTQKQWGIAHLRQALYKITNRGG